jgi:predicted nucleic-acid-binding protein
VGGEDHRRTNILLGVILEDDPIQTAIAKALLEQSSLIAIPVPFFCEFVWTLRRLYKRSPQEIANAIQAILHVTDRPAVQAGLGVLRAGGDFADGTIAWRGAAMGGETLVTVDRDAVRLLTADGMEAQLAGETP